MGFLRICSSIEVILWGFFEDSLGFLRILWDFKDYSRFFEDSVGFLRICPSIEVILLGFCEDSLRFLRILWNFLKV